MGLLENLLNYSHKSLVSFSIGDRPYKCVLERDRSGVVSASFGTTSCNERLARAAYDARCYFNPEMPAILQREIFDNYVRMHGVYRTMSVGTDNDKDISRVVSEIDTRGVLQITRDILDANFLDPKKVVYIAHPAHMHRVIDVGKKLGLYGVPFFEQEVEWSDADDRQRWTISPARWALREVFARIHHRIKGYT